jgi:hypothetical protein
MTPVRVATGFVAGFLSVLVFMQGFAAILHAVGILPSPPWSMAPTGPLGVPRSIDAAFWGGLWGIVYMAIEPRLVPRLGVWPGGLAFGAVGPVLVLWLIVLPLKGAPVGGGFHFPNVLLTILLHAVFGLGTALLFRLGRRMTGARRPAAP